MYRCEVCRKPSQPGKGRLTHVVKKEDGNILREMGVCFSCKSLLDAGITLNRLLIKYAPPEELPEVKAVKAVPPPLPTYRPTALVIPERVLGTKVKTKARQGSS